MNRLFLGVRWINFVSGSLGPLPPSTRSPPCTTSRVTRTSDRGTRWTRFWLSHGLQEILIAFVEYDEVLLELAVKRSARPTLGCLQVLLTQLSTEPRDRVNKREGSQRPRVCRGSSGHSDVHHRSRCESGDVSKIFVVSQPSGDSF